jgi:predicted MPP superfamily phosphohydrolase
VSAQRVRRVVSRINTLDPDLVVLLGDYMNTYAPASSRSEESRSSIRDGIASFGALEARYGVASVLGNRDARYDRAEITEALEEAGVAVLWNRRVVVPRSGGPFAIVGLADARMGSPDFARAIDGAPEGADLIVLTHNPDVFAGLPDNIALTLAAHTHCGQVTIPFLGRLRVPSEYGQKYACHLVEEGARKMFVTSGIGTSSAPVRFLNRPEIAFITLKGEGGV